ncbi:D(2) dopamine receptor-like [Ruditapes philippinarum]|uniref:D(2) dopamine receptor-like n=1 Tax=Ruditapes philippinarum TaxID=129788 RepID=UPI00295B31B7|nr:D(2) dopamine receptor-like [Ruditapes philippinarum]
MYDTEENAKLLEELNGQKIREYAPAIAYSAFVMLVGISGNLFSIAYYGFKTQKTTTNSLITALAVTDLITCVVFCDEIIELCFTITFENVIGCKIMYFTNHTLVIGSAFILILICVDRFRKICRRQSWQLTLKSARIGVALLLFLAVILSVRDFAILDVVQVNLTHTKENKTIRGFYCTHTRDVHMKTVVTVFQLIDLATFIIVISTTAILYTFVAREIWIQRKLKESHTYLSDVKCSMSESESTGIRRVYNSSMAETASSTIQEDTDDVNISTSTPNNDPEKKVQFFTVEGDRDTTHSPNKANNVGKEHDAHTKRKHADAIERKIAIMMIVLTVASILCFVPYFIVNLAVKRNSNTPEQEFSVGIQIALRSFMLNNAVNPYILCYFNTQFKKFVKDSICKCRLRM